MNVLGLHSFLDLACKTLSPLATLQVGAPPQAYHFCSLNGTASSARAQVRQIWHPWPWTKRALWVLSQISGPDRAMAVLDQADRPVFSVAMVRDPVERFLSHFFYSFGQPWTELLRIRNYPTDPIGYLEDRDALQETLMLWQDGSAMVAWFRTQPRALISQHDGPLGLAWIRRTYRNRGKRFLNCTTQQ